MKQFYADVGDRIIQVSGNLNDSLKTLEAEIRRPEIRTQMTLPVGYQVFDGGGKLSGDLLSFYPDDARIRYQSKGIESELYLDNGTSQLLINGSRFKVSEVTLNDYPVETRTKVQAQGFVKGYSANGENGSARFSQFERNGKTKVVIESDIDQWQGFLPLLIEPIAKQDSKLIKKITQASVLPQETEYKQGQFAKWVSESIPIRILNSSVKYKEQNGERHRFSLYMNSGIAPVLLNGPTGNGKTTLIREWAQLNNRPFYFVTGSDSFRTPSAIGKFVNGPTGPVFAPGPLTLATIHGGIFAFEEMAPVPQDELTEFNILLETGELQVITQFGPEVIHAHPNFRFVAAGNFNSSYTSNQLNDATLQRFTQIKFDYPNVAQTSQILLEMAPGINISLADKLARITDKMRKISNEYGRDLGLKGPVKVAQILASNIGSAPMTLIEDFMINPLTTYELKGDDDKNTLMAKLKTIAKEVM